MGQKELLLGSLCLVLAALAAFGGLTAYRDYEQSSRKSLMRERVLMIAQNMKKREHTCSFTNAEGSGDGYNEDDFAAVTDSENYYMYSDHGLIGFAEHRGENYVIGLLDGFNRRNVNETAIYVRLPDGDERPRIVSSSNVGMDLQSLSYNFYDALSRR